MKQAVVVRLIAVLAFYGGVMATAHSAPPKVRATVPTATTFIDTLTFGDTASEKIHAFTAEGSDTIQGGLGTPARRLSPSPSTDPNQNWQGGKISFRVRVHYDIQNYVTVRFWGDDVTANRLFLYVDGKQVGYRHLGDVDQLDFGSEDKGYNGRFFYVTTPLPLALTQGKKYVNCEIRATGPIWGYGTTFAQYQKPMTTPSRGIYALYTHTDGFFAPPAKEKQGLMFLNLPVRATPGREVLDAVKARVNREVAGQLASQKPLNQMQMQFLARAYAVKWTQAYRSPQAITQIVKGLDHVFVSYRANPKLAQAEPSTWNPDWFGLGPSGDVLRLLPDALKPFLDQSVAGLTNGETYTRRAAYTEMLVASRDWHRLHRRLYTNQTMINDLYIYLANRGVALLEPAKALPEPDVKRYLYESVGLVPWTGSDRTSPDRTDWQIGENYYQLTAKGLTKELGYVGTYGEVQDWVAQIYEATQPALNASGDPKIRAQAVKIARARSAFRYPMLDAEGNRAIRMETVIGWRDAHYPGDVVYGQRSSRDGDPLQIAGATLDPQAVGAAQQMLRDNQYFASVEQKMRENGLRITAGLLDTPDLYEKIAALPLSPFALPMTPGQPDFVFTDEEDGVVALKNGTEMLYVSLYWRARNAVNSLARVHHVTPTLSRIATVWEDTQFDPSGLFYTRPDHTNFGFANGGLKYPGEHHSAHAGEKLPIAKIPAGVTFKPGDESVYAGKGMFYTLRYGPYLIGMNCSTNKTYSLMPPHDMVSSGKQSVRNLVSGKSVAFPYAPIPIGPRSTVVLYAATP